jgi:Zn-dependent protease with chaperone function
MEAIFIYLLKSSGLIALFFIAYYFLLRKETFFDSNRWFLLSGLTTSLLLPLFFIKKVVYVERPKYTMDDLMAFSNQNPVTINTVSAVEAFDWMQFIWVSYVIIASILLLKIVFSFVSLYRMLFQQQIIKKEQFKLINLNQNIAPFSFFNYIVINSNLYTNDELQSILLHEKIHSQEKHSIDILITKIFCILFWFNPFVWLYKKAITQNLEYIADQKAMQQLEDKKSYQRALLKVVSNQNCLSITNNFYQSLIKKRIVMLNKNQSHKRNSLKYALILPALIGFVFLFQIKTIAQEKIVIGSYNGNPINEIKVKIDKNSSEETLKQEAKRLKEEHDITLKCSKVKRNPIGEITEIKVEYKDKNGNKGVTHLKGDQPIEPFVFFKSDNSLLGFTKAKPNSVMSKNGAVIINGDVKNHKGLSELDSLKDIDFAYGTILDDDLILENDNAIIVNMGNHPKIVVNGKIISDNKEIEKALAEVNDKNNGFSYSYNSEEDGNNITINGKKLSEHTSNLIKDARVLVNKLSPEEKEEIKKHLAQAKIELSKSRDEIAKSKVEIEKSRQEISNSKIELDKSRDEIAKSRENIAKSREEIIKSRAEVRESIRNASASHSDKTKNEMEKVKAEIQKVKEEMLKVKEELAKEKAKQKH